MIKKLVIFILVFILVVTFVNMVDAQGNIWNMPSYINVSGGTCATVSFNHTTDEPQVWSGWYAIIVGPSGTHHKVELSDANPHTGQFCLGAGDSLGNYGLGHVAGYSTGYMAWSGPLFDSLAYPRVLKVGQANGDDWMQVGLTGATATPQPTPIPIVQPIHEKETVRQFIKMQQTVCNFAPLYSSLVGGPILWPCGK